MHVMIAAVVGAEQVDARISVCCALELFFCSDSNQCDALVMK